MELNLIRMVKVNDLNKDGKVLIKQIRVGMGQNVKVDSTIKARLKVIVDDKQIINNYPEINPLMTYDL